jgi:large subunit ribosomal protein L33
MAKNKKRKIVGLVSETTGERLYYTTKRNDGDKVSLKKYNPHTRQHEVFTETKKNLGRNEVKKRK